MPLSVKSQNELYETISKLLDEMTAEDSIDMGQLSISEEESKNLIISSMIEHYSNLRDICNNRDDVEISLLAMATKLALENFILHSQRISSIQ